MVEFAHSDHRYRAESQDVISLGTLGGPGKARNAVSLKGRYIGNVYEGELLRHSVWQTLELPE
jgi:hypothetical protein